MNIVLATGNPGKARELGALLGEHVRVAAMDPGFAIEETGTTFSRTPCSRRARHARSPPLMRWSWPTTPGSRSTRSTGARGCLSARYAGPSATDGDNCARLLEELDGTIDRRAAFVCVLVALAADETMTVACGACPGVIAQAPRGDGGFGYDPVFVPDGRTCAMAELTAEQKNAISHRGRAVRRLADALGVIA